MTLQKNLEFSYRVIDVFWDVELGNLLEERSDELYERLAEIYSNNNDKWIGDEERGDSVDDRYDGCCG